MALESSFQGGVKRELLRSLCQVVNETQLRLEVALADGPGHATSRPPSGSRGFGRQDSMVSCYACVALPPMCSQVLEAQIGKS